MFYLSLVLSGIPLAFEAPGRIIEIAQYQFPKFLEGTRIYYRNNKVLPEKVPFGSVRSAVDGLEFGFCCCNWDDCLCLQ